MKCFFMIIFMGMMLPGFKSVSAQPFDWQGHRGARGLMPENSIPAFKKALELGVTTLEMDVVITSDSQVVVSHEPWMSPAICLGPDGKELEKNSEEKYNIYTLSYQQVTSFDCGTKPNRSFPEQEKLPVHKPLLSDVFRMAEKYCKDQDRNEIFYNIEIKSREDWDSRFHPPVNRFCDLVYREIDDFVPWRRVTIQSFDVRVLRYFHQQYPNARLAYLIESEKNPEKALAELGFNPAIYSPYFKFLSSEDVTKLHAKGILVVPWTVNDTGEMKKLMEMGVDGIITDYPNLISLMKIK